MKKAKKLVTLDAETDPFLHGRTPKPFIWGAFDGEKDMLFRDALDTAEYFKRNPSMIYAHNGGKFDYFWLFEHADNDQEIKIINGRLSEFRIGDSTYRDSLNIYPQGLATHDKGEIDYKKFEAEIRDKHMDEILPYLARDCRSLHQIVSHFRTNYGHGLTLAGTALKEWERISEISRPRTNKNWYDTIYPYYFGGRVERYQLGCHKFDSQRLRSYDIVSSYPNAMCHPQPWGANPLPLEKMPKIDHLHECFLHIACKSWGAFALRKKTGGVCFPSDGLVREFHVTGWELKAALSARNDWDLQFISGFQFQQSITFDEYVHHFFEIKRNAPKNSAEREFAKLLLNGLYGKFSCDPSEYCKYKIRRMGEPRPEGWTECSRAWPWSFYSRPLEDHEQFFLDLSTGAGITGFARAKLYTQLVAAGGPNFWDSKDVFYCDTDCIHTTSELQTGAKNLGEWDMEFEATEAAYAGKKLYSLVGADGIAKNRSKGVQLDKEQIFRVASGETLTWKKDAPTLNVRMGARFLERDVTMT